MSRSVPSRQATSITIRGARRPRSATRFCRARPRSSFCSASGGSRAWDPTGRAGDRPRRWPWGRPAWRFEERSGASTSLVARSVFFVCRRGSPANSSRTATSDGPATSPFSKCSCAASSPSRESPPAPNPGRAARAPVCPAARPGARASSLPDAPSSSSRSWAAPRPSRPRALETLDRRHRVLEHDLLEVLHRPLPSRPPDALTNSRTPCGRRNGRRRGPGSCRGSTRRPRSARTTADPRRTCSRGRCGTSARVSGSRLGRRRIDAVARAAHPALLHRSASGNRRWFAGRFISTVPLGRMRVQPSKNDARPSLSQPAAVGRERHELVRRLVEQRAGHAVEAAVDVGLDRCRR
jgi:hypothetical protein